MRIVCWQTIIMKCHTLFFRILGKMLQKSSAAVVNDALRGKSSYTQRKDGNQGPESLLKVKEDLS